MVAAVLGNVVQVGFQFSAHPLKFDWSKIKFDPGDHHEAGVFLEADRDEPVQVALQGRRQSGSWPISSSWRTWMIILKTPDVSVATGAQDHHDDRVQDHHLVGGAAPGALDTGLFFPEARVHRFVEDDQGRDEGGVEGDHRRSRTSGRGSARCSGRICCGP